MRSTARYCSDRCRKRAARSRAREAKQAELQDEPDVDVDEGVPPLPAGAAALVAATLAELEKADRASSPLGLAALALAVHIHSPLENGSARAAMVKEFRATLAAALDGHTKQTSTLDEVKARRDKKKRSA